MQRHLNSQLEIRKHVEQQEMTTMKKIIKDALEIICAAALMTAALAFIVYVI